MNWLHKLFPYNFIPNWLWMRAFIQRDPKKKKESYVAIFCYSDWWIFWFVIFYVFFRIIFCPACPCCCLHVALSWNSSNICICIKKRNLILNSVHWIIYICCYCLQSYFALLFYSVCLRLKYFPLCCFIKQNFTV